VFRILSDLNARIFDRLRDFDAVVRAAIVDDDNLEIGIVLRKRAFEAGFQIWRVVVARNDDGYALRHVGQFYLPSVPAPELDRGSAVPDSGQDLRSAIQDLPLKSPPGPQDLLLHPGLKAGTLSAGRMSGE